MPGFDGTGPQGGGAVTGGGRGFCVTSMASGAAAPTGRFFGRGQGFGGRGARGMGRGMGRRAWLPAWNAQPTQPLQSDDALTMLKGEAAMLKGELSSLQKQIDQLEKEAGQENG